MEEILASIRRIIADDDGLSLTRRDRLERLREVERREGGAQHAAVAAESYAEPALERRDDWSEAADGPRVADRGPMLRGVDRPEAAPDAGDCEAPRGDEAEAAFADGEPLQEAAGVETSGRVFDIFASADEDEEAEEVVQEADAAGHSRHDAFSAAFARAAESLTAAGESEFDEAPGEEPAPPLMSQDAASSIAAHFQALAASMVINDSGLLHEYAKEMLRPMLKQWLDDNLPVIVERLVRAEIERVARGGRR